MLVRRAEVAMLVLQSNAFTSGGVLPVRAVAGQTSVSFVGWGLALVGGATCWAVLLTALI